MKNMELKESKNIVILITAADTGEAQRISGVLLEEKKAACVNVISGVNSLFWWDGKLDSAQESLLVVKTKTSLLPEVINLVKGEHSYDVPEIIALPIIGGNPDYLEWIDSSLS